MDDFTPQTGSRPLDQHALAVALHRRADLLDGAKAEELHECASLIATEVHPGELARWIADAAEVARRANGGGLQEDVVAGIARALFDDPQRTDEGGDSAREELPGTGGLLHRGQSVIFFAARGEGKSILALLLGVSAAVAGTPTYYFDRENGASLTRTRYEAILDALEWPDVLADGHFIGRHYPQLDRAWSPDSYGQAIASKGIGLVIYDSLREAISQLGGDPNSDADISRFIDLAVTPLVRRDISVAILDNIGHEAKNRPKGSGSKLDAIPQAYLVETKDKFSPVEIGRIEIKCTRSRFGDEERRWTARMGRGIFEIPQSRDEAPAARAAHELREKREEFRRATIAALHEHSPLGRDDLITAARKKGTKGRNERLRDWLAELAADPASGLLSTDEGYIIEGGPAGMGHPGATPPEGPPGPDPPFRGEGRDPGPGPGGHPAGHPKDVPLAAPEEEEHAPRLLGLSPDDEEDS